MQTDKRGSRLSKVTKKAKKMLNADVSVQYLMFEGDGELRH